LKFNGIDFEKKYRNFKKVPTYSMIAENVDVKGARIGTMVGGFGLISVNQILPSHYSPLFPAWTLINNCKDSEYY